MHGQNTQRPPMFCGENFSFWKDLMKNFIDSQDMDVWDIIEFVYTFPTKIDENGAEIRKPRKEYTATEKMMAQRNAKALNFLYCALHVNEYNRVAGSETAKEIWDKLTAIHEGTNQVKDSKLHVLMGEYETFMMKPEETIRETIDRFLKIFNTAKVLGQPFSEE